MTFRYDGKMDNMVSYLRPDDAVELTIKSEINRIGVVKCDFSKHMDTELRTSRKHTPLHPRTTGTIGPLRCQIRVSPNELEAVVFLEEERVGSCSIEIEVE